MESQTLADTDKMPEWAETVRRKYRGGETTMFVLHGNVFDQVQHGEEFLPVVDYIRKALVAETKPVLITLDPSLGVQSRGPLDVAATVQDGPSVGPEALAVIEHQLRSSHGVAVVFNYADVLLPQAQAHFLSAEDRACLITVHRWSLDPDIFARNNIVILLTESLSDLNSRLVSNPRIAAVNIPLPDSDERARAIKQVNSGLTAIEVKRLAASTSGLRLLQLAVLMKPDEQDGPDEQERHDLIVRLLGTAPNVKARAEKLASITAGMSEDEIATLVNPEVELTDVTREDPLRDVMAFVHQRKQEIIEQECAGLIEFVDSSHGLEAVGGMEGIKLELSDIAAAIKGGDTGRIPMGLLFVGAMGSGKTFVAKCFAHSSGLPAIVLKNFRDRWVGSTEANLERVLDMIKALGPIILIIDEGDRAFGGTTGETDGGTSSRIIARLKAFMSDPENRGRVLFILMTNRPDKLDVDIKRAGRLDRKIPLFYPQTAMEVGQIVVALSGRYKQKLLNYSPTQSEAWFADIVGYSIADIEEVVLLAARNREGDEITQTDFSAAAKDYLPARDVGMLRYMELLAVFEASRRSLLPDKYRDIGVAELNDTIEGLRRELAANGKL